MTTSQLEQRIEALERRHDALEKFILQGAENDWADKMDRIRNDSLPGVIKSTVREGFFVDCDATLKEQ
jgi:hypothetical protein|tara:strand:- start:411 stop:614 length:204 start_codon:yes stop_codon:yes gene_type:complete